MKSYRILLATSLLFLLTYCSKDDPNPIEQDLAEQGLLVNYTKISSYPKEQINTLIRMYPELSSQVTAQYNIDLFTVMYKTKDPFGKITHAKTEASATIDMLRAGRKLCDTLNIPLNNQLFLCGYSQGGHAAMATHKMIKTDNCFSSKTITANYGTGSKSQPLFLRSCRNGYL